jgi:hypothetical protein
MPATHDSRPIGVFDSGLGGLTAVRELFRALPGESVVYFGDTARLPYGGKSKETVTRFALEIASFLVRQNMKCLLVACNTFRRMPRELKRGSDPSGRRDRSAARRGVADHGRSVIGRSPRWGAGPTRRSSCCRGRRLRAPARCSCRWSRRAGWITR